jgi:hypothetical protein
MSFIATAIVAAGAVVSAAGAIYAGKQQKAAADYNAKVQSNQAELEFLENKEQLSRMRTQNKRMQGRSIAMRAAQGVDISAGSSLLLEAETAESMQLSLMEQNRSSDNTQRNLRAGARITKMQGKAAQNASYFSAGASLLGGASSAIKTYKEG